MWKRISDAVGKVSQALAFLRGVAAYNDSSGVVINPYRVDDDEQWKGMERYLAWQAGVTFAVTLGDMTLINRDGTTFKGATFDEWHKLNFPTGHCPLTGREYRLDDEPLNFAWRQGREYWKQGIEYAHLPLAGDDDTKQAMQRGWLEEEERADIMSRLPADAVLRTARRSEFVSKGAAIFSRGEFVYATQWSVVRHIGGLEYFRTPMW